jgi:hypothetical protein
VLAATIGPRLAGFMAPWEAETQRQQRDATLPLLGWPKPKQRDQAWRIT